MSGDPKRPDKLGVTTAQNIVVSVVAGAIFSFAILRAFDAASVVPPVVPWSVPVVLGVCSLVGFFYARSFPKRLEKKAISAQEGLTAVVAGKSMLMTGAVLAGGHLIYIMSWTNQLDIPGPRERVIHGVVTLVVSLVFAWVGAMIERVCIIDLSDPDAQNESEQLA